MGTAPPYNFQIGIYVYIYSSRSFTIVDVQPNIEQISTSIWRVAIKSQTLPPFDHTNSFVICDAGVGFIVEAPEQGDEALSDIKNALEMAKVKTLKGILLTHTHPDHCTGIREWQEHFDVPVFVHPLEQERLEKRTEVKQVRALQDKRVLTVGDKTIESLHTPGHSPGHLSFFIPEDGVMLAGDLVAGAGSTWVGHPEGNVTQFLDSIARLKTLSIASRPDNPDELALRVLAPGHGDTIYTPAEKLDEVAKHRLSREKQVLDVLEVGNYTLSELRQRIYPTLPNAHVERLSEQSILAHLIKLMNELKVVHLGEDEAGPYAIRT